jgi:hypothetical protein
MPIESKAFGWLFSHLILVIVAGTAGLVLVGFNPSHEFLALWGLVVFGLAAFLAIATLCLLVGVVVTIQLIKLRGDYPTG